MTFSPEVYIFLVTVVTAAAILNGATGFGFAIVFVAGVAAVLDPKVGIIVLSLVTPVLTSFALYRHRAYRAVTSRLWMLLVFAIVGSVIGTQILIVLPSYILAILLGIFVFWYALSSIRTGAMQLDPRWERYASPAVGLLGGVVNGTVGASGPVIGSYLVAIGLKGRDWIFAITVIFWTMSVIRVATLAIAGQYTADVVLLGLGLAVPAYLFQAVGFRIQGRFAVDTLQRLILVILLVASAILLWRGIAQFLGVWMAGGTA